MDKQKHNKFSKKCLLKLRHGQYMGNAKKQLFFGKEAFLSITCPICNPPDPDTWLHVLLECKQHHIHATGRSLHCQVENHVRTKKNYFF